MIKTFYQEDIINRLGAIITYGLNEEYSYKTIEEYLLSSSFINALEKNQYNNEIKIETVVENTYHILLSNKLADISFRGLFIAETYFKLFLYFKKSFEYLFLYWPLSFFVERYGVYHEMDFSQIRLNFEAIVNETTLLKKLSRTKQIKLVEVSKLTGINVNTIDKYSRDDKYLYGASYDSIYKLSNLFNVKESIFLKTLPICLDEAVFLFDKRNSDYRNYLGLLFANYYDKRVELPDFKYDKNDDTFISKSGLKIIVVSDALNNLTTTKITQLCDSNTYLVIFPYGFLGDESSFAYMKSIDAYEILVVTQEYVYFLKKCLKKEITDTINNFLIIRATVNAALIK